MGGGTTARPKAEVGLSATGGAKSSSDVLSVGKKWEFVDPKQPRLHRPAPVDPSLPLMEMSEVAKHNTPEDLWLVLDGVVYDVTKYYPYHPGGTVMYTWGGRDASDPFRAWHSPGVRAKLGRYAIGRVEGLRTSQYEKEKRELFEHVETSGLYKTDYKFYFVMTVVPLLFLAAGLACVVVSQNFYVHMVGALLVALCWHQSAFLGHDLMHNQVMESIHQNHYFAAVYGSFMTGLLGSWWKYTHNMHHAVVNEWERDPDITHLPLFAVTSKMFLHKGRKELNAMEKTALKILVPLQHILYVPVMAFARFNLYAQGILLLATSRVMTMPLQRWHYAKAIWRAEVAAIAGFWVWTLSLYGYIAKTHGYDHAFWFIIVSHLYLGMLHVQITLSHWERPMHSLQEIEDDDDSSSAAEKRPALGGDSVATNQDHKRFREGIDNATPTPAAKKDGLVHDQHEWFFQQITTGHNINSTPFVNWYFGGLNWQIEHHIFPRVPRHNLPQVVELIVPFCKKWGIPYCSSTMGEALGQLWESMHDVGQQVHLYEQAEAARVSREKHDAKLAASASSKKTE